MQTVVVSEPVTVTLRYALTPEERRRATIETGRDPGQTVTMQVALDSTDDPEVRDLLLTAAARNYAPPPPTGVKVEDYPARSDTSCWVLPYSEDPTEIARGIIAAHAQAHSIRAAVEERELAETRASLLANPPSSLLRQREGDVPEIRYVPPELRDDPDVAAAVEAAQEVVRAEKERLARERAAERERAERERAEAERAYVADREAWIAEHGSSRLRRLVAEGIEHDAVYRDERLAMERPAWQWSRLDGNLPGAEPRNAPEEALDLLDAARADDPDAVLRYLRPWRHVPHDEDPEGCDRDPDNCSLCDEDGRHIVYDEPEYRAYAMFLGRRIVTRTAVAA